jgi:hypothetical protein
MSAAPVLRSRPHGQPHFVQRAALVRRGRAGFLILVVRHEVGLEVGVVQREQPLSAGGVEDLDLEEVPAEHPLSGIVRVDGVLPAGDRTQRQLRQHRHVDQPGSLPSISTRCG